VLTTLRALVPLVAAMLPRSGYRAKAQPNGRQPLFQLTLFQIQVILPERGKTVGGR